MDGDSETEVKGHTAVSLTTSNSGVITGSQDPMVSGQSIFKYKVPSASDQLLLAMQNATNAQTVRGELPMTTKAAFQTVSSLGSLPSMMSTAQTVANQQQLLMAPTVQSLPSPQTVLANQVLPQVARLPAAQQLLTIPSNTPGGQAQQMLTIPITNAAGQQQILTIPVSLAHGQGGIQFIIPSTGGQLLASGLSSLMSPPPAVTQAPVSLVMSSSSTSLPSITTVASSLAKSQVATTPSMLPTTPLPPMSVLAGQSALGHQLPLPQMLMNNTGHVYSVSPTTPTLPTLNSSLTTNGKVTYTSPAITETPSVTTIQGLTTQTLSAQTLSGLATHRQTLSNPLGAAAAAQAAAASQILAAQAAAAEDTPPSPPPEERVVVPTTTAPTPTVLTTHGLTAQQLAAATQLMASQGVTRQLVNSQGQVIAQVGGQSGVTQLLPSGQVITTTQGGVQVISHASSTTSPTGQVTTNVNASNATEAVLNASEVDGINLEEIKDFAKAFKIRRLSLGLTQTQVGQALSATEGPAYSQSAICRFEKLDITPKSAQKIKPVLERWMEEAEERHKNGLSQLTDFIGSEPTKKRKRRTSFTPQALEYLNIQFEKNTHPSGAEMTSMSQELNYDREVIRVWFCNKRQALKNTIKKLKAVDHSSVSEHQTVGLSEVPSQVAFKQEPLVTEAPATVSL
ncbi:uncharacterized protein [Amphiura filiformis]|uniref:uncharacterized protein n=1 Tax=Amphiura filiformis TaxID=82378 RepID=UPI003B22573B